MNSVAEFKTVEKWLTFRASTPTTKNGYVCKFAYFLKISKINPDELINEWKTVRYDPLKKQKFIDKISEIIEDFYVYLMNRKTLAELTKRNTFMTIKSFMKFYNIPLEFKDPSLKACVTYHNRDIKKEEIRKILDVSKLREKTFFLMMCESGLRPDTMVKLKYKHIKQDFEKAIIPMKIWLPAEVLKDRVGDRFSFVGEDGYNLLKSYLSTLPKLNDDDYLFQPEKHTGKNEPLPPTTFSNYFRKIAIKLGLTEGRVKGKPNPLRLYCLRKYFRNNCKAESSLREFWMGHSLGVDEHYIQRDVELHRRAYAEAYPLLRIYEPTSNNKVSSLEDELKKAYQTIGQLQQIVTTLASNETISNILGKDREKLLEQLQKLKQ
jgi:integrase